MSALNPDPFPPKKPFEDNTYYQILYVEPSQEKNEKITTTILAKTRGNSNVQTVDNSDPQSFNKFELDEKTVKKLKDYPRRNEDLEDKLSSYLPSPGVVFPQDFINSLSEENKQTELGNFYVPMRTLLHSRKISQFIAKTWWAYLEAKKTDLWHKFSVGEWDTIDSEILDGLIAREIFLYGGADSPDNPDPEDSSIYFPLKPEKEMTERTRFLILPSSRAWQGISLSLLLAGQAYYKIGDEYHQICQPIFSTGEITIQYSLEVDWNKFNGNIREIIVSQEKPWIAYHVVIPYPPMPFDADQSNIEKWADAEDDGGELPFYNKTEEGEYLIDVKYFRPPYPYIPLSCT